MGASLPMGAYPPACEASPGARAAVPAFRLTSGMLEDPLKAAVHGGGGHQLTISIQLHHVVTGGIDSQGLRTLGKTNSCKFFDKYIFI